MSVASRHVIAPSMAAQGWTILLFVFPGVFLPIDVLYAVPGIAMYATPDQAARIALYLVALAFGMAGICWLLCVSVGIVAGRGRNYDAGRAGFAALWVGLSLFGFAVLHGLLIWSSHFVNYSADLRWLRELLLAALAVTAGYVAARRAGQTQLSALAAIPRAGALLMAILALGAVGVLLLGPSRAGAKPPPVRSAAKPPPIFLITLDTLSALHLPMYGYARPTAPRLAEFAGGATVFLRNYASSNFTTSSVASLLLGVRPWDHRVIHLEGRPLGRLGSESIQDTLRNAGYWTASIATNPWASPRHLRLADGFDSLAEHRICVASNPVYALATEMQTAIEISLVPNAFASLAMQLADALGFCRDGHFDPEAAFSEARHVVASAPKEKPLFLWIHLFPPHAPYVTPAPFVGTFNLSESARSRSTSIPPNLFEATYRLDFPGALLDRYDESIRYVDHHVGAFFDYLKHNGVYDRALIVVTADHGESFTKGYANHGGPMLHDQLVRVPLLIKAPEQKAPSTTSSLSELVDIRPTLLAYAGIDDTVRGEGMSLVPAMIGQPLERSVFSMNFQQSPRLGPLHTGSVAMIYDRWKFVHYVGNIRYPWIPRLSSALYDVFDDPRETRNLVREFPDVATRMRSEIERRLNKHGGRTE